MFLLCGDCEALRMEKIEHKSIQVNGLKLHIAEIGSVSGAPTILFLHGFPQLWYSWRFQMIAVADAGYRAIAPDFRGYGSSDPPAEPEEATFEDFVADVAAILDALHISKVENIFLRLVIYFCHFLIFFVAGYRSLLSVKILEPWLLTGLPLATKKGSMGL